jgi:microcystin-dependent protein/uncharacterized protein YjbI with pentapeptide repeats
MATITKGKTFTSNETVTPTKLNDLVDKATISGIVNADIAANAAIADTKLATISTAAKVANSATTATNANTANAIVARDASGNFSAGTITASLSGNSSSASQWATGRNLSLTGAVTATLSTVNGSANVSAAATIASLAVTTGKIADANVTTAKIADANVTTAKIADANVTTAKIADANVTTAKIASLAVTTAKITDANVTTAKIADANVTTAKIADANVTTAKIANGSVTAVKLGSDIFLVPPGAVMPFAMNSAPAGWLAANGTAVSRTTYATLFSAIGTIYGAGNGSTTFTLPDLRGYFVRGHGTNADGTVSGSFGVKQADEFKSHSHTYTQPKTPGSYYDNNNDEVGVKELTTDAASGLTGGTETRPKNIAMLYCIKF